MVLPAGILRQILLWLAPPTFDGDADKTRQAALVNLIALTSMAFTLVLLAGNLLGGVARDSRLIIDLIGFGVVALVFALLRRGWVAWARMGLTALGFLFVTAAVISIGTIRAPSAAIYVYFVLATGLLFGLRGIVLGGLAASLAVLGLIVCERAGWLPQARETVGVSDWVTFTALFVFTSGLTNHILAHTRKTLARVETEAALRKQSEAQLLLAKNDLIGMLNALPDLLFDIGQDGVVHRFHSPRADLLALPPDQFLGRKLDEFLPPEATYSIHAALREARQTGVSSGRTYALDLAQGRCWFELSVTRIPGSQTQLPRFICLARDITRRQQSEDALRKNQALLQIVSDNARDIIWTMHPDGRLLYVSPSVKTVRGYTPTEAMAQTLPEWLTPDSRSVWLMYFNQLHADCAAGQAPQSFRGELQCVCQDGTTVWTDVMAHPLFGDGGLIEIVGVSRDITAFKRLMQALQQSRDEANAASQALQAANAELVRIAITDPLTGVWNRRHFVQVATAEREKCLRYQQPLSMLLLDIDHFKHINDGFGHPTGDRVLVDLSQRLVRVLRKGDVLARWGGEEFVVILPHCAVGAAMALAEKLRALVAAEDFAEVGRVTVSLGVAEFCRDESLEDWFKRVDLALYAAKSGGRNAVRLASPGTLA